MTISARRIGICFALVAALVVFAAWIDGGEEPLRDIAQPVPLPESAL